MTTYTSISGPEVAAGAALTTSLMTALRDNPLAIQEGDPSAPKIVTDKALAPYTLTTASNTGQTATFTLLSVTSGVSGVGLVRYEIYGLETAGGTGVSTVEVRTSTNGGSTWSSWTQIDGDFSDENYSFCHGFINMETGAIRGQYRSGTSGISIGLISTTPTAGPINAFQVRLTRGAGATLNGTAMVYAVTGPST